MSRRQFFNRATIGTDGCGPHARSRPPASSPSCGRSPRVASVARCNVGKQATTSSPASAPTAASSTPPKPAPGSRSTRSSALPKAEGAYQASRARFGMRVRASSPSVPEVPAPRLPRAQCKSSQWFECPCHGSQYNRVGEKKAGPAPARHGPLRRSVRRRLPVTSSSTPAPSYQGRPIGTNTTGQEAEGPHCV